MAVRSSARASRGRNRYVEELLKQEQEGHGDGDGDGDGAVRCPGCGTTDANYDADNDPHGDMIQCDGCNSWQHIRCMTGGKSSNAEDLLNAGQEYYCELCSPSSYAGLFAAETQPARTTKHGGEDQAYTVRGTDTSGYASGQEDEDDFVVDDDDDDDDDDDSLLDAEKQHQRKRAALGRLKSGSGKSGSRSKKAKVAGGPGGRGEQPAAPKVSRDDKMRQNALKMFVDLFCTHILPDTAAAGAYAVPEGRDMAAVGDELAKALEKELYKACYDADTRTLSKYYPEMVRTLFANLKDKKNLALKSHVANGTLPYDKLVRMKASELANPDLREFKQQIDSKALDKVVIEMPDRPLYHKTHKGDELIEEDGGYNQAEDMIYSRNSVSYATAQKKAEGRGGESGDDAGDDADAGAQASAEGVPTPRKQASPRSLPVVVSYADLDISFAGRLEYLGGSKEVDPDTCERAVADGQLQVEGRLSRQKVFDYLKEIRATRVVLVYKLQPPRPAAGSDNVHLSRLTNFLLQADKVAGVKSRRRYVKDVYLMPVSCTGMREAAKDVLGDEDAVGTDGLVVLVVIRPELLG